MHAAARGFITTLAMLFVSVSVSAGAWGAVVDPVDASIASADYAKAYAKLSGNHDEAVAWKVEAARVVAEAWPKAIDAWSARIGKGLRMTDVMEKHPMADATVTAIDAGGCTVTQKGTSAKVTWRSITPAARLSFLRKAFADPTPEQRRAMLGLCALHDLKDDATAILKDLPAGAHAGASPGEVALDKHMRPAPVTAPSKPAKADGAQAAASGDAPRMLMTDATYAGVVARNSGRSVEEMIASAPPFRLTIESVGPGSNADQLGIKVGEALVAFDGVPPHDATGWSMWRRAQNLKAGAVTVWSKTSGTRIVQVPQGLMGIGFQDAANAVALLAGHEKAVGYADLVQASLGLLSYPTFCETALARAAKAGCTDPLLDGFFGIVCAHTGRQGLAVQKLTAALKVLPVEQHALFARAALVAAISSMRIDDAKTLIAAYPDLSWEQSDPMAMLADLATYVHPGDLPGKLPSVASAKIASTSLLDLLRKQAVAEGWPGETSLADGDFDFTNLEQKSNDLGEHVDGVHMVRPIPTTWVLAAPFTNGICSTNVHFNGGVVSIVLRDEQQNGREELAVHVISGGMLRICPDHFPELRLYPGLDVQNGDNLLEIRLYDGWWEVDLGHQPLAYGPRFRPDASVVPSLELRMAQGHLLKFDVRSYEVPAAGAAKGGDF